MGRRTQRYLALFILALAGCSSDNVPWDVTEPTPVDSFFALDTIFVTDTLAFVRDSALFDIVGIVINDDSSSASAELGEFKVPPHEDLFGVEVFLLVDRSGPDQEDEAYAVFASLDGGAEFAVFDIGGCPVVPDNTSSSRFFDWLGTIFDPVETVALRVEHAFLHSCFESKDGFDGSNSVHFLGVLLVYWRQVS